MSRYSVWKKVAAGFLTLALMAGLTFPSQVFAAQELNPESGVATFEQSVKGESSLPENDEVAGLSDITVGSTTTEDPASALSEENVLQDASDTAVGAEQMTEEGSNPDYGQEAGQSISDTEWQTDEAGDASAFDDETDQLSNEMDYSIEETEGELPGTEPEDVETDIGDNVDESANESFETEESKESNDDFSEVVASEEQSEEASSGSSNIEESEDGSIGNITEDEADNGVKSYIVTLDANGGRFENEQDDLLGVVLADTTVLNKVVSDGNQVTAFPVFIASDQNMQTAEFLGWSFSKDGNLVSEGYEGYVPTEDCTLYAVWAIAAVDEPDSEERDIEPEKSTTDESELRETNTEELKENSVPEISDEGVTEEIADEKKHSSTDTGITDAIWLNDIIPVETTGYYYRNNELLSQIEDSGYTHAVEFDASYSTSATYHLSQSYDQFSGIVCTGKSTGTGLFTITILGDGKKIHEITGVSNTNNYISFNVDISGVKELEIQSANSGEWANGWVYIADGQLKLHDFDGISSYPVLNYGGHLYQISSGIASFSDAAAICEDAGGHLVSITSENENNAICNYLSSNGIEVAMTGLYGENGVSGPWDKWSTGEEALYQNWQPRQPDWEGQHICVIASGTSGYYGSISPGQWDNGWDGDYVFICEWDSIDDLDKKTKNIYTIDDLKNISNNLSGSFKLMNDIDLSRVDWEPIGSSSAPFTGEFDGNGYVISNLLILDNGDYKGLFGFTDGAFITRVSVTGMIYGGTFAGGIASYSKNSNITYSISKTFVSGAEQVGGIVGRLEGGSLDHCMNIAPVIASARGCGGITGDIYPSGKVTNCLNLGRITGGTDITGGIAGGSTDGYVASCVNAEEVTCKSGRSGAIAGDNASYAGIRENNYFLKSNLVNNGYSEIGDNCGTFSTVSDNRVTGLKEDILSGNGIRDVSILDVSNADDGIITMKDSYSTTVGEETEITAEIYTDLFVPSSSNMSWTIESSDDNDVVVSDMSILNVSNKTYTLSSEFNFSKPGKYIVTLKNDQGSSSSTTVTVYAEKALKITQPSTKNGYVFAGDVNTEKNFTMTLDQADEAPKSSDFLFDIKKSDNLTTSAVQNISNSEVDVKDIRKISDRKYEIMFSYKPDETGFYGFTVKYKDNVDETELMVYDSNFLEKLENDLDKTLNTYYSQYGKRIKSELKNLAEEEGEKTDYILEAQKLKADCTNLMNGNAMGYSDVDVTSIDLCAFEALARYYKKVGQANGIKFDEIDNDTAASMIIQKIAGYVTQDVRNNLKSVVLDSKAVISGEKYSVKASTNIFIGNGSIRLDIQDKSREGRSFIYSITNRKAIESATADYINAVKDLNNSAQKNAAQMWYKDFAELLGWDILKDIDDGIEIYRNQLADDIVQDMEKHGIKNLLDNLKTCRNYYKQGKEICAKLKNATSVLKSKNMSAQDKIASLYEIKNIKINTDESGDCAGDVYNLLKNFEDKWKNYLVEYFTTGTIENLEPEYLMDSAKNGWKNIFKCPVSITVVNPAGQAAGYVGDDDIWFMDPVYIEEDGDAKIIYTPKEAGYTFNVEGTDYGLVSYTVQELTNGNLAEDYLNFFDIPVENGTEIHVQILKETIQSEKDVAVTADEVQYPPETASISSRINVYVNNDSSKGTVTGAGTYMVGEMAFVKAVPSEGYYFAGWYEGDKLKTFAEDYQFEVRNETVLTAAYLHINNEGSEEEEQVIRQKPINSGKCGKGCAWTYFDNGDLNISGTGEMDDFKNSDVPWKLYRSNIKNVHIGDGIEAIGNYAFYDCKNIESITLPDSLLKICDCSFQNCERINSIDLPLNLTRLGNNAFSNCTSIKKIIVPEKVIAVGDSTFSSCKELKKIVFCGDAPVFGNPVNGASDVTTFFGDKISVFYPDNASGWNDVKALKWSAEDIKWYAYNNINTDGTCTIIFNANGGNIYGTLKEKVDVTVELGEQIDLKRTLVSNSDRHKKFIGWSAEKNGNPITDTSTVALGNNTYFAVWQDNLIITFDYNGKYSSTEYQDVDDYYPVNISSHRQRVVPGNTIGEVSFDTEISFPYDVPMENVLDSDSLVGWSLQKEGGRLIDISSFVPGQDCTLYAVWKDNIQNLITVTVNSTEGYLPVKDWDVGTEGKPEEKMRTVTYVNIDNILNHLDQPEPKTSSHKFVGWSMSENGDILNEIKDGDTIYAVWKKGVEKINIKEPEVNINCGSHTTLHAFVDPIDASNPSLKWESSNPSIVQVDNNGKVTGVAKGTAVITAISTENEDVKASCKVTVIPLSVLNSKIDGIVDKTYTGSEILQSFTVKYEAVTLIPDSDYIVKYKNNTNAGTATVTITGKGNYKGTKTETFEIKKAKQLITVKASASSIQVGRTATVSITGGKGEKSYKSSDNTIASVDNNGSITTKKVGTVTITATSGMTPNYEAATKTVSIKVTPVSITKAAVTLPASKVWTGWALTPVPTVKLGGKTLKKGTDFILAFKNNKNVGTATVTITGKGNYAGTIKKTFRINPKPTSVSKITPGSKKLTVTWRKQASQTIGYQIQYSSRSDFKTQKIVTVTGVSKVSVTLKGLAVKHKYYVRVRTFKTVGGTKYYSTWSPARSAKTK